MCPQCLATAAMLLASAVSAGGVGAVAVSKFRVKEIVARMFRRPQKEKTWEQPTSK